MSLNLKLEIYKKNLYEKITLTNRQPSQNNLKYVVNLRQKKENSWGQCYKNDNLTNKKIA